MFGLKTDDYLGSRWCPYSLPMIAGAFLFALHPVRAELVTLVNETFDTDPVGLGVATVSGDGTRFSYHSPTKTLSASYDTSQSTTKMIWPLGANLTDDVSFQYSVGFTILNQGFFADSEAFAQIAFGLVNSGTTGNNRSGGPEFSGVSGSAYDVVSFDYFPNITDFGGPTLGPSVIQTDHGAGFFSSLVFPFGDETDLTAEGALPLGTSLTAEVDYDAVLRLLSLRIDGQNINTTGEGDAGAGTSGGPDGDATTIQNFLPADVAFSVDSFAITLWEDEFRFIATNPTVTANVVFDGFNVAAEIPEPASVIVMSMLIGFFSLARRKSSGFRSSCCL